MTTPNRAYFSVSNTPSTSGNLTVSTAVAGPYRTLTAADDGLICSVSIVEGNAWEVRTGCVYTHSTTTLTRGTLEESSTGSAIDLTSSAKVMLVGATGGTMVAWNDDDTALLKPDGAVAALSEAVAVVELTATGTAVTGACEFRGFVVRAETGGTAGVTIYDATSATGTPIMTVDNISTGTYYWDGDHATPGVGSGGRRVNATGCHVVIAGTCTIDVMVE